MLKKYTSFILVFNILLHLSMMANQPVPQPVKQNQVVDTHKEKEKSTLSKKTKKWIAGSVAIITALAIALGGGYAAHQYLKPKVSESELEKLPLELQLQIIENVIKDEPNLVRLQNDMIAYAASSKLRSVVLSLPVQEVIKKKRIELLKNVRDQVSYWKPDIGNNINTPEDLSPTLLAIVRHSIVPQHIIKLLVDNGANVNTQNIEGQTPAMLAALDGFTRALQTLIDLHADLTLKDNKGRTIMSYTYGGNPKDPFVWQDDRQRLRDIVEHQEEAKKEKPSFYQKHLRIEWEKLLK